MGQYQRFLLIADPTLHQSPAQLRAVALAKAAGAVLDVRAFVEPVPMVHLWQEQVDDAEQQRYLRRYRRWEAEELDRLSDMGLEVTVKAVFTTHPLLDTRSLCIWSTTPLTDCRTESWRQWARSIRQHTSAV